MRGVLRMHLRPGTGAAACLPIGVPLDVQRWIARTLLLGQEGKEAG